MKPPQFLSDSTARAVRSGLAAQSLESVTQRLARAEEALGLQFTRIAQLQAQLDVVLGDSDVRHVETTRLREPLSRSATSTRTACRSV